MSFSVLPVFKFECNVSHFSFLIFEESLIHLFGNVWPAGPYTARGKRVLIWPVFNVWPAGRTDVIQIQCLAAPCRNDYVCHTL